MNAAPPFGMPIVRDVMTHRPTAILRTASIRAALATMTELDVRHLPVINQDHELVGILSDRDLRGLPYVEREVNELMPPRNVSLDDPIELLMSADVISVEPDEDLKEAVEFMIEHRIGAIPVVNPEGRLVGIVSYLDCLQAFDEVLREAAAP